MVVEHLLSVCETGRQIFKTRKFVCSSSAGELDRGDLSWSFLTAAVLPIQRLFSPNMSDYFCFLFPADCFKTSTWRQDLITPTWNILKTKTTLEAFFSFVPIGQRLYSVMHGLVLLDWTANCLKSTNHGGVVDCRASLGVLTQPCCFLHRRFCGLVFPGRIYGASEVKRPSLLEFPGGRLHIPSALNGRRRHLFLLLLIFFFNLSLHSRWPALFCDVFFQHCTWTPRSRVVVSFCSDVAATLWSLQSRAQLGKKSFSTLARKLFCVVCQLTISYGIF